MPYEHPLLTPLLTDALRKVRDTWKAVARPGRLYLLEVLVPTLSVDVQIRTPKFSSAGLDLSAAEGILATVPAGKVWILHHGYRSTSANSISVFIKRGVTNYRVTPLGTTGVIFDAYAVELAAGDKVGMEQGGVTDTAVTLEISYTEVDVV